jgi:hypothetical protein
VTSVSRRTLGPLLWVTLTVACTLAFLQAADRNYRSAEGRLGKTMPPYQVEIIAGTAPAPYVYRQAVPQLRDLMMRVLPPGHVAVLADVAFALVAMASSIAFTRALLKTDLVMLGMLIATLACITVYPNDKPEAVAAVAVVCLISALVLTRHQTAAIIIAILAAPVRPEIPILFGLAMMLGQLLAEHFRPTVRLNYLAFGLAAVGGGVYLLVARYLLWPDARYPADVSPFMLLRNLTLPIAWPTLAFGLCLLALCFVQVILGYSLLKQENEYRWSKHVKPVMSLEFFCLLSVIFLLFFAQAEEIRVFQPFLMPVIIGGVWIQTQMRSTIDAVGVQS